MDFIKEKFGEEGVQLYEVIDDVIMKLKFSCRMAIECNDYTYTFTQCGTESFPYDGKKLILKICDGNANIRVTF